jgi:propionyl-CoA synthetase
LGALGEWFADGEMNTCFNALDRHVAAGRADQKALIYDSPMSAKLRSYSYRELRDHVARVAGMLRAHGVDPGDRVVIYMPMVPEAVMAMLACARIGAVHSVVFGGFAAAELAKRIDDAKPKLVLSASCGLEPGKVIAYKPLLDKALELAHWPVSHCIILQREELEARLHPVRDRNWDQELLAADAADCVPVKASSPLYILYTSGTTGKPKGVVRDHGGHAVALDYSMRAVYDAAPGDVFWAASDVGWVVGHSYIVYAPLIRGCTTVLYEGKPVGTPDAGAFWRVVHQHQVNILFTAPTAIRAIKKADPQGQRLAEYPLSSLRSLFLAGERSDPDTIQWAQDQLRIPVIDHWWQTELGWPAAATPLGLEGLQPKTGSAGRAMPGFQFKVLADDGSAAPAGQVGSLVLQLPLPPGTLLSLWNNEEGLHSSYLQQHPGHYLSGDAGIMDDEGYLWFLSRTDDVINVAGHRLSTGTIEEIVSAHPAVAECAVFGVADALKGQVPLALVVLKDGQSISAADLAQELVQQTRAQLGAVACLRQVGVVQRLPKTRSGKVLRKTLRQLADGEQPLAPATIDDPAILDEIEAVLIQLGYARPHTQLQAG